MPSITNELDAANGGTDNKQEQIDALILRAWRERWTDTQWGIYIKAVLPPTVSGDTYNLAEQILHQAFVGLDANKMMLTYLRHSLGVRQVSYTAIIRAIPRLEIHDRPYCMVAIFDLLNFLCDGVCCHTPTEEISLPGAMLDLASWTLKVMVNALEASSGQHAKQCQQIILIAKAMIEKVSTNHYVIANWHIAMRANPDRANKLQKRFTELKRLVVSKKCVVLQKHLELLPVLKSDGSILKPGESSVPQEDAESITLCLQPYVVGNVLLHPNYTTKNYVAHLQMIQRLKNYPLNRIYSELIRAAMITLHTVTREMDVGRQSMWSAFAFIKVPNILKQLHISNSSEATANLPSVEMMQAIETIIDDPMFDNLDVACNTNSIEYLLEELVKHNLITKEQGKAFTARRDPMLVKMMQIDLDETATSTLKQLQKAESLFGSILRTLDIDPSKVQDSLLEMLCELLSGGNIELILSVATMDGKLKTFVARLIRWNENSRQASSDNTKPVSIRQSLFDVTFLLLTFIVQTYGSDAVLDNSGSTFFERWVRDHMLEKGKNKAPLNMVLLCDQSKVDEFMSAMNANEATGTSPDTSAGAKHITLRWHDICRTMPAIIYQLLVAWENHTISAADVKGHFDNIRKRLCSYSVCAASWLCTYMQSVSDDQLIKPQSLIQQLYAPVAIAPDDKRYKFKEAIAPFTAKLIQKIRADAEQNQKARSAAVCIKPDQPLEEQFHDVWRTIAVRGWLSVKGAQVLDNLLQSCGPYWIVAKMVNEVLLCKFQKDLNKTMDIIFAIMHLNIEKCTITLLNDLLPMILLNKTQKFELIEPQLSVLARLCVYSIVSALEIKAPKSKRASNGGDASDTDRPSKVRKLNDGSIEEGRPPNASPAIDENPPQTSKMREPLKECMEELFQLLYQLTFSTELTPKVIFVHQFLVLLHRYGGTRIRPILPLIPNGLMQNLFKILSVDDFSYDFILKMHDLSKEPGRRNALADLSMYHMMKLKYPGGIPY